MFCFLNNKFVQEKNAKISIFDRSFKYGENIFETILLKNNNLIAFGEHIDRLYLSAKYLKLKLEISRKELTQKIEQLVEKNKLKNCLIRIMVTRGIDKTNQLKITKNQKTTLVITCLKFAGYKESSYLKGVSLKTTKHRKINNSILPTQAKIGAAYVPNILAKEEALSAGYFDALFLDDQKNVLETTIANIFWLKNDTYFTPSLDLGVFPGITRDKVIFLIKKLGYKIKEGKLKITTLLCADEVFLTYTSAGIMPVNKIDQQDFKIGQKTELLRKNYSRISRGLC